jgi:hypothetical protein
MKKKFGLPDWYVGQIIKSIFVLDCWFHFFLFPPFLSLPLPLFLSFVLLSPN